ncbi:MAG: tetratricopeptide repeat protein, partial [Muribaculaceae bacterium]|nr:tetratricopeptide repeat protein [Muribaculaceae bacterium]
MNIRIVVALAAVLMACLPWTGMSAQTESNRKERRCISEGNSLYNDGRYRAAMAKYQEALKMNPNSAAGRYNLGLSQIRLGTNP